MFKQIVLNQIAAILKLAAIATLKRKTRDGNIPGIIEYIDKGFPPCCLLLRKMFRGVKFFRCVPKLNLLIIALSYRQRL